MMRHVAVILALLCLTCCRSTEEASGPAHRSPGELRDAPEGPSGWCKQCNMEVYAGHICTRTTPCNLCGREKGARHVHEVSWVCPVDGVVTAETHICNDSKTCVTCRADKRKLIGPRGCRRCYAQIPPSVIEGLTTYCEECNQEVGANHIHGKTAYCLTCLREAGEGHVHDATRLCMEHQVEHGPDHVCGTTEYCKKCHREAGLDHKHGVTEWCWRCGAEKDWPHSNHD